MNWKDKSIISRLGEEQEIGQKDIFEKLEFLDYKIWDPRKSFRGLEAIGQQRNQGGS